MSSDSKTFIFKNYEANLEKGLVLFNYAIEDGEKEINFQERIEFEPPNHKIPQELLKSILNNLSLIIGISYWKLYCPKEIQVELFSLSKEQALFWNKVYTKGLGEFFYKNKIDFRGLINFPYNEKAEVKLTSFPRKNRSLIGIGGGKDSIVVAELLRKSNKEFDLVTSGFPIQIEIAKMIGGKVINTFRQIDPKLLELNKEKGTYNGHIPVSAIYAFIGVLTAILYDYKSFVVGNEKSANYGNVEYLGEMINHQWSKSEEFEKLFNEYACKFITPDITYLSPLRNMTELQVVGKFVKYPKYFNFFSSCNKNFKTATLCPDELRRSKWCGKCPKCLFVFISLAAFLPKKEMLAIFGKNLFEEINLIPLFEELIGVRNFKPFECVGTPEEVKEALAKILEKGEFNETSLIKHLKTL